MSKVAVKGNTLGNAVFTIESPPTDSDRTFVLPDNEGTIITTADVGTIASQDSDNVSISGGTIAGITDLAVEDGGTGASNDSDARVNLGLGDVATQSADNINIDGGMINGTSVNATTLTASGDVNFDSGTLFVDASTNNVGIGTTAPLSNLEIEGDGSGSECVVTESGQVHIWEGHNVSGNADTERLGVGKNNTSLIFANNAGTPRDAFAIGTSDPTPLILSTDNEKRVRINTNGEMTVDFQPGFHAYLTSEQTLSGSGWEPTSGGTWSWDTQNGGYNTGNHWNSSNNRFTAPVAGKYFFYAIFYAGSSTNAFRLSVSNGNQYYHGAQKDDNGDTNETVVIAIFELNANDYVDLNVGFNPSGTLEGGSNTSRTRWGGHLLG